MNPTQPADDPIEAYLGEDGRYYVLAADGQYYAAEDLGLEEPPRSDTGVGEAGGRRRHSPRVVRRRRIAGVAGGALAVILVVVVVGIFWALGQINPGGKPGRDVTVVIPAGSSTARIGAILARAGVIHDATLFHYYVKIEGGGPLYAGTYRLATNESYGSVINVIDQQPVVLVDHLVIPEGFTLRDIAARVAALPGMHISAASFLALSARGSVRSPFEPRGIDNLEGLVFPATYDIARNESGSTIMQLLVQTFDQRAASIGLTPAAAAEHLTPYQVVTEASIVQAEAKFIDQYPDTASVLTNRLRLGMTLGADSTLVYELRQKHPDLDLATLDYNQPNPYNTRVNKGLPPTPIDSPSLPALRAALHPPSTQLLYFVETNPDGQLGFASTNSGFDQLIAECQTARLAC